MNDCDCAPGHRCDCWDYRSSDPEAVGLDELAKKIAKDWNGRPDARIALLQVREVIATLPEPTLGLKGGVSRRAVLDVVDEALARLTEAKPETPA